MGLALCLMVNRILTVFSLPESRLTMTSSPGEKREDRWASVPTSDVPGVTGPTRPPGKEPPPFALAIWGLSGSLPAALDIPH